MVLLFRAVLLLALLAALHCTKSQSIKTKVNRRGKGRTVKLILDPSLSSHLFSDPPVSSSNTANLSVSPWVYREDCDPSRVPQCLYEAKCLTAGCVNPETGQEDLSLEAKPILYQIVVLHRVQRKKKVARGRTSPQDFDRDKKRYDFRLSTKVVTVGCTCMRPIVHTQN
ncbi:hypothetical protein NQD34_018021 [Periophthalmus magnuspinnatus]|uniref:interleukin 17a/f3 n=1 Tax=Periophthalmus magnuspinnatus TaxID=409849 RepID=UPI00145BD92C|nr:interleukin 17a/f3 [Periophthalmus magnuspinnatus]KAJ0027021.1 hypothetical protein NQD34_018021 [Periophthalmus magnuspinnatus]